MTEQNTLYNIGFDLTYDQKAWLYSDHLPFYEGPINTAPFLDGLARRSVVFERAHSSSSWTAPATASIFTSLYPNQHQVWTGFMAAKLVFRKKRGLTWG